MNDPLRGELLGALDRLMLGRRYRAGATGMGQRHRQDKHNPFAALLRALAVELKAPAEIESVSVTGPNTHSAAIMSWPWQAETRRWPKTSSPGRSRYTSCPLNSDNETKAGRVNGSDRRPTSCVATKLPTPIWSESQQP